MREVGKTGRDSGRSWAPSGHVTRQRRRGIMPRKSGRATPMSSEGTRKKLPRRYFPLMTIPVSPFASV